MGEAEAVRKKAHRFRSVEEKRRIVEETLKAGVSVSSVGRAHGINANQVFQWRKLYLQGLLDAVSGRDRMRLLPVAVSEEAESGTVGGPGATAIASAEAPTSTTESVAEEKTSRRRKPLPSHLPRVTHTHLPKEEGCTKCGGAFRKLGEDVSEVLEYIPASFKPGSPRTDSGSWGGR